MDLYELLTAIKHGEDSTRQFKSDIRNADSLAAEIAAFANSNGGTIFIGVDDSGSIPGLSKEDVHRLNQLISNTISHLVRSPVTVHTKNIVLDSGQIVIALTVPRGIDKPYFDKNGVIWLKAGSDKRRINSKEELKRLFQISDQFHADELPTRAGEDFEGPLRKIFDDAMAFIMRNLHKIQAGRGVNAPGLPEISENVFEELLVNALIHRDYLVSAPIRIFIFDDRIEIISPGHLPDNLTVEKIRTGNSNIRNPILVSYVAKGLLPYHGLGSGIKRALEQWPNIDFMDDRDGCLFTVTVHRKVFDDSETIKSSQKTDEHILELIQQDPYMTTDQLAKIIGITRRAILKQINKLKNQKRLRRVGPDKGGHWEVV